MMWQRKADTARFGYSHSSICLDVFIPFTFYFGVHCFQSADVLPPHLVLIIAQVLMKLSLVDLGCLLMKAGKLAGF